MSKQVSKLDLGDDGSFKRQKSTFESWIKDEKDAEFPAEKGRYHLYISYACPWCTRVSAMRRLKGLENIVSMTVVGWDNRLEEGKWTWRFLDEDTKEGEKDPINGFKNIREVYEQSDPNYSGRYTVPVLYDIKTKRIVNNESSQIIRMFNTCFNKFLNDDYKKINYYPDELKEKIDKVNAWVYPHINNGVYKCGFARTQKAYNIAHAPLVKHLKLTNEILGKSKYIASKDVFTEADLRLFQTLIRWDIVYATHFKCIERIVDYPNIKGYVQELYKIPEIKKSVNFHHIKNHYYQVHTNVNPCSIVPNGPSLDWLNEESTRKV